MPGVYMICTVMCGNTAETGMMIIHQVIALTQLARPMALTAWIVGAVGTAPRGNAVLLTATATLLLSDTTTWGSALLWSLVLNDIQFFELQPLCRCVKLSASVTFFDFCIIKDMSVL